MDFREKPTVVSDLTTYLNTKVAPKIGNTQITSAIVGRVKTSQRNVKPWIPKSFCQYPGDAKFDDFNLNKGLGSLNLQGIMDYLNAYKEGLINSIKSCLAGIGPEGSSDIKLAKQATDFLKQAAEAAKCFTQIITNINNLIQNYIQAIDTLIQTVVNTINRLEQEAFTLAMSLIHAEPSIKQFVTEALFDALNKCTNIYEVIGNIEEIEQQINQSRTQWQILSTQERKQRLHLQVTFALLRNRIHALNYFSSLRDVLKASRRSAVATYPIPNNFLDSINEINVTKASSFNWSLTNVAGLYDYNLNDEYDVIKKMNKLFKNYINEDKAVLNQEESIIIASREQSGYIYVPELQRGLVSAGLDPSLGTSVNLILELSINNGDTLIRATAKGEQPSSNDVYLKQNYGKYVFKAVEKIDYSQIVYNESDQTWKCLVIDNNIKPNIGDYFYYRNIFTDEILNFSITDSSSSANTYYFPALFKVVDLDHNSITFKKMDDTNLSPQDFISSYDDNLSYTITNNAILPSPDKTYTQLMNKDISPNALEYVIIQEDADIYNLVKNQNYWLESDFYALHTDAPHITNPDTWTYSGYKVSYNESNIITLNKYVLPYGNDDDSPHSGEKIPCLNWTLTARIFGDQSVINKMSFSREFVAQNINPFYMKANWGFIPEEIDVIKKVSSEQQNDQSFINKNFFGTP